MRTTDLGSEGIPVEEGLAKSGVFNKISVRVRDNHITTMVNGRTVDFWRDSRLQRGGVGLFADEGDVARVERLRVTGNDDAWGLLLYGTVEPLRSVRDSLSSKAVIVFAPIPAQHIS